MTRARNVSIIQPVPHLPLKRRSMRLWWLSAVLYLMFCFWLGPTAAFYLTAFAAFVGLWMLLCARWPFFAYLTGLFLVSFIGGFIMGLLGVRGGGYYYSSYRRYR